MVGLILSDYYYNRKEMFLQVGKNGGWFFYFNSLIILPISMQTVGRGLIIFYVEWFFILLTLLASRMYANSLPKIMYLCPMSREERKRYLWTGFYLRNFVFIFLFLLLNIGMFISGYGSVTNMILLTLIFISFSLASNTFFKQIFRAKLSWKEEREKETIKKMGNFYWYSGWLMFAQILGYLNFVIIILDIQDPEPWASWEAGIVLFMIAMQMLTSCIVLTRYLKTGMERILDYEVAYLADSKLKD